MANSNDEVDWVAIVLARSTSTTRFAMLDGSILAWAAWTNVEIAEETAVVSTIALAAAVDTRMNIWAAVSNSDLAVDRRWANSSVVAAEEESANEAAKAEDERRSMEEVN